MATSLKDTPVRVAKKVLSAQVADRRSDPRFYAGLGVLPNPDPILRKLNQADSVYDAIASDAHVMGELRSIRAGILGYQLRIVDGVDGEPAGKEKQAFELGQWWFENCTPQNMMTWQDCIWNMATAVFHGRKVHELVWEQVGSHLLPTGVIDLPSRRTTFDLDNKMRLLTKDEPVNGIEMDPYKFVLTRHMPSAENPFGIALFSSCYWPYVFKHGGFKFFYKFCERYGTPWPIGKYPAGTDIKGQTELLDALVGMLDNGAAVVPEGDAVELVEVKHSGELAQESLIHLCNREMSKALTSQTLATEMRQVGSNAASKTHSERQQDVQQSDRNMIAATMNEILRWITVLNFGADTAAPKFEFFKPKDITEIRLKAWEAASRMGNPSRRAFHDEMNIPEAEDESDVLTSGGTAEAGPPTNFSKCSGCGQVHNFAGSDNSTLVSSAATQADQAIENHWLKPAVDLLAEFEAAGKSLEDFQAELPRLYGALDDSALIDITNQALRLATAEGMDEAAE